MKKILLATAAALMTLLVAYAPAQASLTKKTRAGAEQQTPSVPKKLLAAGTWTASYFERNSDGDPMCVVRHNVGGHDVQVKHSPVGTWVHLFKSGWRIPDDTKMRLSVDFKDKHEKTVTATGGTQKASGRGFVRFTVKAERVAEFIDLLGSASTLTLTFMEGSEQPWSISLNGGREVSVPFMKCAADIDKRLTQPFSGPQSAKPE